MADREFLLRVVGDVSNAQKSLGNLEKDVSGFKDSMKGAAIAIGGAFAVSEAVDFGKQLVNAASDQEQAFGAVNAVFGEYADTIHESAKSAASDVGLATSQYEQLATLTGALLKNAGLPLDEVADKTRELTQVGADLSAMYGGTAAEAMGKINSALKGEFDPIESLGVSLKATAIEQKAVAMGMVDAAGKATDYGKKMATIALIQEQAADSAGTFAREQDTVAGRSQILKAQFTNLQAELGQKLLPTIVTFANVLIKIVDFVSRNQDWLVPLATGIVALVAGIKAWTLAQAALNLVMTANPVMLIVVGIAALIAAIVVAYKKVEWFREGVDAFFNGIIDAFNWVVDAGKSVWNWFKTNWPLLLAIITGPFGLAIYAIIKYWDELKAGTQRVLSTITDIITWPFRKAWDWITWKYEQLAEWFRGFPRALNSAWSGLSDIITWPFRKAFDLIKWLWNSTVGGFGFEVPSWVPGVGGKDFKIPKMAAGGIVSRPTIALLGEAGPEAVVPLSNGGFGGPININVYALTANAEVGRKVYEALREYERTSGR